MRKITYVKLHQAAFLPGVGEINSTLPAPNKSHKLDMFHTEEGVLLQINGKEALIPWPNVVIAALAPEEKAKKESKQ